MPPKLHDFMSKYQINNTDNSFEDSIDHQPKREGIKPNVPELLFNRFKKSKGECIDELTVILEQLNKKENDLSRMVEKHNAKTIQKFNEDYDTISQQIVRQVELHLREQKERYLREIKNKRGEETQEVKLARRNIDKIRDEVTSLR